MQCRITAALLGAWRPALPLVLAALALLISVPAWRVPFWGDDLVQAAKLLPEHPVKERGYFADAHRFTLATMTLFDWFHPGLTQQAIAYGVLPWWTSERAQQSFWRPLSAATHWLDYRLWPSHPLPMRVHSAAWFAAFLVMAWALYRSLGERAWVAGLATLFLALNQENWQPLVWIAARNTLITAFFVALTLYLHRRHVWSGCWTWAAASWCALAAGLLAGEGAITATAYLFSYALFLDRRPWKARFLSLIPFAIVVLLWRAAYQGLGFRVVDSGLYVDPGSEPARYLLNLAEWGPLLLLDVLTSPILGKYASLAPQLRLWAWGVGLTALILLAALFAPLVRRDRAARFWSLGLLLALVPACATTVPDDRITLYAMFGFAPLAASFVAGAVDGAPWVPRRTGGWLLALTTALLLIGLHALQPLPGHVKRLAYLLRPASPPGRVEPALCASPDEELIVVNPPDVMYLSYLPYFLIQDGLPLPDRMRTLSSSLGDLVVRRTAANMLTLISPDGPLIPTRPRTGDLLPGAPVRHDLYKGRTIGTAFRAESLRFEAGARTELPGMTVVVDRVDGRGHPTEATFTFERQLDDPCYRWVYWDRAKGSYAPFMPPPLGEERRVTGPLPANR